MTFVVTVTVCAKVQAASAQNARIVTTTNVLWIRSQMSTLGIFLCCVSISLAKAYYSLYVWETGYGRSAFHEWGRWFFCKSDQIGEVHTGASPAQKYWVDRHGERIARAYNGCLAWKRRPSGVQSYIPWSKAGQGRSSWMPNGSSNGSSILRILK